MADTKKAAPTAMLTVRVLQTGNIPYLNRRGPIARPMLIPKSMYDNLKRANVRMEVVESKVVRDEPQEPVRVPSPQPEEKPTEEKPTEFDEQREPPQPEPQNRPVRSSRDTKARVAEGEPEKQQPEKNHSKVSGPKPKPAS